MAFSCHEVLRDQDHKLLLLLECSSLCSQDNSLLTYQILTFSENYTEYGYIARYQTRQLASQLNLNRSIAIQVTIHHSPLGCSITDDIECMCANHLINVPTYSMYVPLYAVMYIIIGKNLWLVVCTCDTVKIKCKVNQGNNCLF